MAGAEFWIVAGPNGAGKTTLTQSRPICDLLRHVVPLNPDDRTLELLLARGFSDFASTPEHILQRLFIEAAEQVAQELEERLERGEAVSIETVLSTDKYKPVVERVRIGGGYVGLIYIALRSSDLARQRVALRVLAGGHDVPAERIAARWRRSIDNLTWFARHSHYVWVYDNSDTTDNGTPLLIADNSTGTMMVHQPHAIPEITQALLAVDPQLP